MASYEVVSAIKIADGAGNPGPGGEKRVWSGLTKEEVVRIESVMAEYLKGLAKAAEKRLKGQIPEPIVSGPEDLVVTAECVINRDGKEWAMTSIRLPNQNGAYIGIMAMLYAQAVSRIPKKINAKMTVTAG